MSKYSYGLGSYKNISEGNEVLWMIGNGIGGYSNHTICGGGASSFHGYLIASLNPPVKRVSIFTRTTEKLTIGNREYDLTSQEYINSSKNGQEYIEKFEFDTIPTYYYKVEDVRIKKTIALEYGHNTVAVCYEVENGFDELDMSITPLFNYRSAGEVSEKSELKFKTSINNKILSLVPEANTDVKINFYSSKGEYYDRSNYEVTMATPNYLIEENNYYKIDNRTGFLGVDNHFTPYEVRIKLKPYEKSKFYFICSLEAIKDKSGFDICDEYKNRIDKIILDSEFEDEFMKDLIKASDHFIVKRESTNLKTILAGFPWFTDWGRDTMIAFEGLTLVPKRFKIAREILESFSKYVKNGLVPNLFPDANTKPEYNTVDASMWYFQATYKYLQYDTSVEAYDFVKDKIYGKLKEIIKAYSTSTEFSIGMDSDYLVHAGNGLDQVTWMDVRVGDLVVTPRHGKPVEINALWYNALCIMAILSEKFGEDNKKYHELAQKVKKSFNNKFWNEDKKCLYDVVDENDDKIRPNQLWAVSLPFSILDREKEKSIVNVCYKHLYNIYGMRSLSFLDPNYKNKYIGKLINRDKAYHMGTTWGFLIGPFITAYMKVNDYNEESLKRAKEMCLLFRDHMKDGCINGIAEIFDGDFPSTSRGCYSQAWSVGEVMRAYNEVLIHEKNN